MKYKIKAIISGNVVEVYRYGIPVRTGKDRVIFDRSSGNAVKAPEEVEKMKQEKSLSNSLRRTRNNLRRLINANTGQWGKEREKFFTLTFKENVTDHETANAEFVKFVKRLNYHVTGQKRAFLKYVCVVERQERGALHYHIILFNMPYVPHAELLKLWGHGAVTINAIDHVDNVGAYVVKYIEKTMHEMESKKSAKEKDKKMYFPSRGLLKPKEISDGTADGKQELQEIAGKVEGHEVYRKMYESEHYDTYEVIQYNLARKS